MFHEASITANVSVVGIVSPGTTLINGEENMGLSTHIGTIISGVAQLNRVGDLGNSLNISVNNATGVRQIFVEGAMFNSLGVASIVFGNAQLDIQGSAFSTLYLNTELVGVAQTHKESAIPAGLNISTIPSGVAQIHRTGNLIGAVLLSPSLAGIAQTHSEDYSVGFMELSAIASGSKLEYQFTVTFYGRSNEILKTQIVYQYGNATPPVAPTVPGYSFAFWDGDYTNVNGDVNVYAIYNTIYYYVRFENWDGAEITTQYNLTYGQSATPPATPTRTGYNFSHWTNSYQNITGNVTTRAVFTIKKFTVSFYERDGSGGWLGNWYASKVSYNVEYSSFVKPPIPSDLTSHIFTGWDTDTSYITADTEAYAEYQVRIYTVTWVYWETISTESVSHGSSANEPTNVARPGYTFNGWDKSFSSITGDTTITAQYTAIIYTVTYRNYDNSIISTVNGYYLEDGSLGWSPSREGYIFAGWFLAASGGTQITDFTLTENLTVYAQWTEDVIEVTVYFDSNGGNTPSISSKVVTVELNYGSLATVSRTNHTFLGWFTASVGGSQVTSSTAVSIETDHTLYAQWESNYASNWLEISGSSFNGTINYFSPDENCQSVNTVQTALPAASSYLKDYIIRLRSFTYDLTLCTTYYFKAV